MKLRTFGPLAIAAFVSFLLGSAESLAQNAYVAAGGFSQIVGVLDTATNTLIARIPDCCGPFRIAAIPGGSRVYVTQTFPAPTTVNVIDTATNEVIAKIPLIQPGDLAAKPDGSRVYVTGAGTDFAGAVSVIATATNGVIATIPVSAASGIAVTPDGSKVYVSANPVSVINTATNRVVASIPISATGAVAVTPDGSKVYIAGSVGLYVIDTATNAVTATIPLGVNDVAVSPDGSKVYVTGLLAGQRFAGVSVIDAATNVVIATVDGFLSAATLAVTPDGGKLYVTDPSPDVIGVIDTATNAVTGYIFGLDNPVDVSIPGPLVFAGTPGTANCIGQSVSALAQGFGGLNAAAVTLGFSSVGALQDAIMAFCGR